MKQKRRYLRDYRPGDNPWEQLPQGIEKIGRWYRVIGDPDNLQFLTRDVAETHRDDIRRTINQQPKLRNQNE
jgi:hypothetical protein